MRNLLVRALESDRHHCYSLLQLKARDLSQLSLKAKLLVFFSLITPLVNATPDRGEVEHLIWQGLVPICMRPPCFHLHLHSPNGCWPCPTHLIRDSHQLGPSPPVPSELRAGSRDTVKTAHLHTLFTTTISDVKTKAFIN